MSVAVNAFAYEEPGKIPSIALAVAVHVLLAAFLFFGVRWQSRQPETVSVELWDSPPAPAVETVVVQPEPPPKPELEPQPRAEQAVELPRPEVKPEPRVEKAVEPPKPDIALEKKKDAKKAPPKQVEPKKVPEKKPEPKLDLDRSEDIRAQLERETTALEEQSEKNRILEQMQREAATFAERAYAAYIARLKAKIKGNIVLPPDIHGNPEAIFDVVQLPTGEVMSVKLRKSSGHKAYDDAVERAIFKSSPLPRPDRAEQFQRNLAITFRPLD